MKCNCGSFNSVNVYGGHALLMKDFPDFKRGKIESENPKLLNQLTEKYYGSTKLYNSSTIEYFRNKDKSWTIKSSVFMGLAGFFAEEIVKFCSNCGDDLRKL